MFVSPRGGQPMEPRPQLQARENCGFEGDAHARPDGARQVLLLDAETLAEFGIEPGALKENITTEGVNLAALAPGTRLRVGVALLEITKECAPCESVEAIRPGLLEKLKGRRGQLARVLEGGPVQVGDRIEVLAD